MLMPRKPNRTVKIIAILTGIVAIAALIAAFTGHLKTIIDNVTAPFKRTPIATASTPPPSPSTVQLESDSEAEPPPPPDNSLFRYYKSPNDAARHLTDNRADPQYVRAYLGVSGKGVWVFPTRTTPTQQYKFEYTSIAIPSNYAGYTTYVTSPTIVPVGVFLDSRKKSRLGYFICTRVGQ